MQCYRDMTFCTFYKECADGVNCHRALTEKVREAAKKWNGAGIAQFVDKPECFKETK